MVVFRTPAVTARTKALDRDLSLSRLYSFVVLAYVAQARVNTEVSHRTVPVYFKLVPARGTCGQFCVAAPMN